MLNRKIITVAAIASSLAVTASPAVAKGGHGGGGTAPAPAPDPQPAPWTLCPEFAAGGPSILPDGSSLGANEIPGVLCVVDRATPTGSLLLYTWRVGPGWVADVRSSGGGNSNKIDVQVTNSTTREKHEITVQPGKTVIR